MPSPTGCHYCVADDRLLDRGPCSSCATPELIAQLDATRKIRRPKFIVSSPTPAAAAPTAQLTLI